jgi:ferredoxin
MVIAPKIFDVDEEDKVVLLDSSPSNEATTKVEQAARSCPKNAITLESDTHG